MSTTPDAVQITPGSGSKVAVRFIATYNYQITKLGLGAPDVAPEDAVGGAGVVGPGVMRVTIATDDALLTAMGAVGNTPAANSLLGRVKAVADTLAAGAAVDRSGTIAAANAAQQIMAQNTARREAWVYNAHPTEKMWINITGGTAAANGVGSIPIDPEDGWSGQINNAISGVAASLGHPFTAGER